MSKKNVALLVGIALIVVSAVAGQQRYSQAQTNSTYWAVQFGTAQDDSADSVATDSLGNVYVTGDTEGSLYGTNPGRNFYGTTFNGVSQPSSDFFIVKYNSSGVVQWRKQLGTPQPDGCNITVDKLNNIYIEGATGGSLFGSNAGGRDVFLAKYDPNGMPIWSKQFGTSADDDATDLTVDVDNNVYIVGSTAGGLYGANTGPNNNGDPATDAFVAKFDTNGNLLWGTQYGADNRDYATSVTTDALGNAYVVGITCAGTNKQLFGPVPGSSEAYVAKFTPTGLLAWGKDIGTGGNNEAITICADGAGNTYVGGDLNSGDWEFPSNGFIAKFDTNGNSLWMNTLTTPDLDSGQLVTNLRLNSQGNVVAAGYTNGSLFAPVVGGKDFFVASYGPSGNFLWGQQYGSTGDDRLNGLALGTQGGIYIVGSTSGNLFGTNAGGNDAFVQKISSTGLMASAKSNSLSPYKPLLFAWSGQSLTLSYPPVLANHRPYVYAAYLCSGIPGAKVHQTASHQVVVEGPSKQVVITPNALTYQINGKTRTMSAKPVLVGSRCYVPLDVMKAVLPYPVHYDAKAKTVCFDPPQRKAAQRKVAQR